MAANLHGEHWAASDSYRMHSPYVGVAQHREAAVPLQMAASEVPLAGPSLVHFHSSVAEALCLEHSLLYVANAVSSSLIDEEIRLVAAAESWGRVAAAVGRLEELVAAAVAVATVNVEVQCSCHRVDD